MQEESSLITYPIEDVKEMKPVINIAGRDYAVLPMEMFFNESVDRISAYDSHGISGVRVALNQNARRFIEDIAKILYHTSAFTAIEEEPFDENTRNFTMYLPILLPLDERDKWNVEDEGQLINEFESRRKTGLPESFKLVKK